MPSRTTRHVGEVFTSYSTYSWSECGMYDDSVGWVTCNLCGVTVADEYSYDEVLEVHENHLCLVRKQIVWSALALENLGRYMAWDRAMEGVPVSDEYIPF